MTAVTMGRPLSRAWSRVWGGRNRYLTGAVCLAISAFMVAPIFAHIALTVGGSLDAGTRIALTIGLALALGGAAIGVAIYALGGARPQTPDIDRFLDGEAPAWYSPPLLAKLRRTGVPSQAAIEGAD